MEKRFVDRKERINGKEKETQMKGGKKWGDVELIWELKYRKLALNTDSDLTSCYINLSR